MQVHEKCNFRKYLTPLHCAVPLPLIFKAVFVNANIIYYVPMDHLVWAFFYEYENKDAIFQNEILSNRLVRNA